MTQARPMPEGRPVSAERIDRAMNPTPVQPFAATIATLTDAELDEVERRWRGDPRNVAGLALSMIDRERRERVEGL